ncbi:helix-turn-helix domain-containing protein [Paraburkholderia sp. 2C]
MHFPCTSKFSPDGMKTANATPRQRAKSKWVWLWPRWSSPFDAAVSGWRNLEDAVLLGDLGLSEGWISVYGLQAHIRWSHYVERLPFLPLVVDDIAVSCKYKWPVTANRIDRLAASCLRECLVDDISRAAFRDGVEFLLDSIGLDAKAIEEAVRSPVRLLKIAYAQLQLLPRRSDDGFDRAAFWLVLFGCAVDELRYPNCYFCFRHARHGHRYCFAHSQSIEFEGTRAQKARRYYLGKETAVTLGWDRRKPAIEVHDEVETMPSLIARHLWGTSTRGDGRIFKHIRKRLSDSPSVRRMLGDRIPRANATLEALLRDKLDPLELLPQAWPEKIALAERWLSSESYQTPGTRPESRALTEKIKRAECLASKGMSLAQIARALGCSSATIRSWCARGRAPSLSKILSASRRL